MLDFDGLIANCVACLIHKAVTSHGPAMAVREPGACLSLVTPRGAVMCAPAVAFVPGTLRRILPGGGEAQVRCRVQDRYPCGRPWAVLSQATRSTNLDSCCVSGETLLWMWTGAV